MKLDLIALSNAMTDLTFEITEEELSRLGLKKESYTPLRNLDQKLFSDIIHEKIFKLYPAGSPANVIINTSRLGLKKTGLYATVGNDSFGENYIRTIQQNNITSLINTVDGKSGVCYIMITPDGEKTTTADIGVANQFDFDFSKLKDSRIFHTSGYELVTNPKKTKEAIEYAKKYNVKLSFDLADKAMIQRERSSIEYLLKDIDILFATESEAEELTGKNPLNALKALSDYSGIVILKKGSQGSVVRRRVGHVSEEYRIPIIPVEVKSTCGAGDAYASGFLFAYLIGLPLDECGNMGSEIASRVCASDRPHL
ncbi:putative sugar kinase [uncultured archaeon]|nr:putative sugar kinase [uncultured archaeon]